MKILLGKFLAGLYFIHIILAQETDKRVVCYYDSKSANRSGLAKFSLNDLENALESCTHLIYGYARLKYHNYNNSSLSQNRSALNFLQVKSLKTKYPHLKVYLSLGGDKYDDYRDVVDENKYIKVLEGNKTVQQRFIDATVNLLTANSFDGLDLAFQFPRNKPRKVHSAIGILWKSFKKLFTGDFIVDPEAETHKQQFTKFVGYLYDACTRANLSLTLTVLPNVNSSWYFDIPNIDHKFEYINLFAFDFLTPQRNPEEADYTAPIYLKDEQDRLPHYNIDFQVQHWLAHGCPAHMLNLGIATYARVWKTTADSGLSGLPVVPATVGPAEAGLQSKQAGLLSWPEVCSKITFTSVGDYRGPNAPARKVVDIEHKYGNYAFRPADDNDEHGIWMSFDDPDFAGIKAKYAKQNGLGGVAIYDLSYDDFRGLCTGAKFPILRSVKSVLQDFW